jgi:hypothetical protein
VTDSLFMLAAGFAAGALVCLPLLIVVLAAELLRRSRR